MPHRVQTDVSDFGELSRVAKRPYLESPKEVKRSCGKRVHTTSERRLFLSATGLTLSVTGRAVSRFDKLTALSESKGRNRRLQLPSGADGDLPKLLRLTHMRSAEQAYLTPQATTEFLITT